jgi:hypothetical protein
MPAPKPHPAQTAFGVGLIVWAFTTMFCGCTREVREQSQVREAYQVRDEGKREVEVDTRRTEGPKTTVIEEYAPAGDPVSSPTDGGTSDAGPAPQPAAPAGRRVLVKRTIITQGPVTQETHASATSTTEHIATAQHEEQRAVEKDTRVGPPWWVWVCAAVACAAALYLVFQFRRFIP